MLVCQIQTGGLRWEVPAGRRDGLISRADETFDMPAPFHNLVTITEIFAEKNLSQHDMIALLGKCRPFWNIPIVFVLDEYWISIFAFLLPLFSHLNPVSRNNMLYDFQL